MLCLPRGLLWPPNLKVYIQLLSSMSPVFVLFLALALPYSFLFYFLSVCPQLEQKLHESRVLFSLVQCYIPRASASARCVVVTHKCLWNEGIDRASLVYLHERFFLFFFCSERKEEWIFLIPHFWTCSSYDIHHSLRFSFPWIYA